MIFTSSSALRGLLHSWVRSKGIHQLWAWGKEEKPLELHLGAAQGQPQESPSTVCVSFTEKMLLHLQKCSCATNNSQGSWAACREMGKAFSV